MYIKQGYPLLLSIASITLTNNDLPSRLRGNWQITWLFGESVSFWLAASIPLNTSFNQVISQSHWRGLKLRSMEATWLQSAIFEDTSVHPSSESLRFNCRDEEAEVDEAITASVEDVAAGNVKASSSIDNCLQPLNDITSIIGLLANNRGPTWIKLGDRLKSRDFRRPRPRKLSKTKNYVVMCKLGLLRPKGQYIEKYIKLIEHCGLANISKFEYSSRAFY